MTNRPNGTLYVGTTTNLSRRAWEHREGVAEGFTRRYGLKHLVYFEEHQKHWRGAWKVRLILEANPGWADLYDLLA
jgi:putative endonuclease